MQYHDEIMKYSIIVPVYNKANTIQESLTSIFAQTCQDFEVIVVDDGSTDNLQLVLEKFPKVMVIHQNNSGVSVARNTGIRNASGEFICFLDADDIWMTNHLEVLNELIRRYPNGGMYVTSHVISDANGNNLRTSEYLKNQELDFECLDLIDLLNTTNYCIIQTNSVCIRRSIFEKDNIWFAPGAHIGEDTDVWYRVSMKHPTIMTKNNTTLYRREYSTATLATTYDEDWPFYQREVQFLQDPAIPDNMKLSLMELFDRFRLTGCREAVIRGQKKKAWELLRAVESKKGKRYWFTLIFCTMPVSLCKLVYRVVMLKKP